MTQLESHLKNEDYNYRRYSDLEADFIRRVQFKNFENISEAFQTVWNVMVSSSDATRVDITYDSYL